MTLPANVRLNMSVPFPALIKGGGPVTVGKSNGTWTLGFDIIDLAQGVPTPANYPNDFLIYWDNALKAFLRVSLSSLNAISRGQRLVQSAADLPITVSDSILNLNISAPLTVTLPAYGTRAGSPITILDVGGTWAANNVTFATTGGDLVNGIASASLAANGIKGTQNYQEWTFLPMNDGTSTGWRIV